MGVLTPLFLAGAGLLALPWLIHRIRRPQTKPLRFSSLMFVPRVKKDIIEKRKVQHPLLMMLRMLMLLALAVAFARPFIQIPKADANLPGQLNRRVILLDTSYSMRTAGWFDEAKRQALDLLERLGSTDRVAVVTFGAAPRVLASLADADDAQAGSVARARLAIRAAQPTWETTAYLPALQMAESLLMAGDDEQEPKPRLIVHLVTDFQHAGMPTAAPPWKLSPRIELRPVEVGNAAAPNFAIGDVALEQLRSKDLRIRAKIKNWSSVVDRPASVKLFIGGQARETKTIAVSRGNASQLVFTIPSTGEETLDGWLELGSDALAADNKYYLAWNPRRRHPVLLAADEADRVLWPAARFVRVAVPEEADLPWTLHQTAAGTLAEQLADPAAAPEIAMVLDLADVTPEGSRALLDYVRGGGQALLLLDGRIDPATVNASVLNPLGIACEGPRHATPSETRFATVAWVDLESRIFMPFRDAKYNDFSSLRYYNYQQLAVVGRPDGLAPRVLAKLDDERPIMIETSLGAGRAIVWACGLDLEWTNLPKKAMFVPLLHETLASLTRTDDSPATLRVGEPLPAPPGAGGASAAWLVQGPGQDAPAAYDAAAPARAASLEEPGFVRWRTATQSGWRRVDAVNVDPRESDASRIAIPEFMLRLTSASSAGRAADLKEATAATVADEFIVKREVGYRVMAILLLFLIVETLYATRLATLARRKVEAET